MHATKLPTGDAFQLPNPNWVVICCCLPPCVLASIWCTTRARYHLWINFDFHIHNENLCVCLVRKYVGSRKLYDDYLSGKIIYPFIWVCWKRTNERATQRMPMLTRIILINFMNELFGRANLARSTAQSDQSTKYKIPPFLYDFGHMKFDCKVKVEMRQQVPIV